ncbi:M15 family metallopeptidase [Lacrimispora defluvii]|uniref:M15 family peptidase n=1 Tax=Lacrimispora defluvii TaxID=2719233 RepID=A0ABX1VT98_9FIRM|nr:M15 family metallopeptidase [Lacrimispora defluvii]NNJ31586.1 M15 family peptidase [Lacrimispora defluvii]
MRDITLCHPRLQALAAKLVEECNKRGLKIAIGETYRTVAEQDALYAQGRTKPGNKVTNAPGSTYSSYHQWGTAFDIYRNDGQGAYNEAGNFFGRIGEIGVSIGLEWGGNWKSPVDKPHFQLPDWGSSTSGIKKVYASPEEFKKTWVAIPMEYTVGWNHDKNGWWYADTKSTYHKSCWQIINGHKYRFNSDGYALTGWQEIDGKWYYFEPRAGHDLECALYVSDREGVQYIATF